MRTHAQTDKYCVGSFTSGCWSWLHSSKVLVGGGRDREKTVNGCAAAVGRINSTALWANSGGQTFVCVWCTFFYVCVHVHEGARVFESTHAWMCTWVTEVTLEHLLSTLFVVVCCLFGDGVSRWTWNLAISLTGRLVNPGYPPVSAFPILGLQVVTTMSGCQAKDFTSWTISPPLFDNN